MIDDNFAVVFPSWRLVEMPALFIWKKYGLTGIIQLNANKELKYEV